MAYDDELVERVRAAIATERGVTEKKMFGGLAFLLGGHIVVAASSKGGLMARIDPADADALVREPGVERMVMSGREMDGWLRVAAASVEDDDVLAQWVARGVAFVETLPAKT